jgi:thioredoxin-dependent peroxiredoxin
LFDRVPAQILGASFDSESANAAFARKFDFNFPLLCDTEREIGLAYHACDSKESGAARRITYCIGPDGLIRFAYDKVVAPTHAEQVLGDLTEG